MIKDVTSFLNSVNYDLFRYMFYSQVKNGFLNFELDIKFDNLNQNIASYIIFGSVNNAIINLPGYDNIDDINFNFQAKNKKIQISELYLNYQGVDVKSEKIEAKEKSGVYYVSGDFENSKTLLNPNLAFKHLNIKHDFLSKKDILFRSKNKFSFRFNKNKKIKNFKLHSVINFDEIYFNEKYQNILFLKQGIINSKFDNEGLTAELKSNFVFSNDLNANKDFKNNKLELSFISQNINKIKIKGNISNKKKFLDPKIFLNLTNLSSNILSKKKINIQTDTNFRFEIINSKIENYLLNSEIYLDKLELNDQIQDVLYFKNIKTKLTFGDKLFKINLKSNYSFYDKNLNKESDNNIINIDLNKNASKISDIIIKLNSNITVNASLDDKLNIKKISANSNLNFDDINIDYKSKLIKKYLSNYNNKLTIKNPQISFELLNQDINLQLDGKYLLKDK